MASEEITASAPAGGSSAPPPPQAEGALSNGRSTAISVQGEEQASPAPNQAADSSIMGDEEDEEIDQLEDDDEAGPSASADASAAKGRPVARRADGSIPSVLRPAGANTASSSAIRAQPSTIDRDDYIEQINYTEEEMAAFKVDETIPDNVNPGSANLYTNASGEKLFRNTPIKKNDGGTILRSDLQHALLLEIFDDTTRCFRNPRPAPEGAWTYPPKPGEAAATGVYEYSPMYPYGQSKGAARRSNETPEEYAAWEKRYQEFWKNPYPTPEEDPERKVPRPGHRMLTFKELYMEALMNSPRCTKAVRDKIWQDEEYAQDFLCVNLLINIGRMNTTLAFFAQMQTILRCYHPLPSLQRCENSRKHMQDAPRMKSLLKSVLLPFEKASTGPGSAPASKAAQAANIDVAIPESEQIELAGTMEEVVQRFRDGRVPSTSVVNLIFLFQQEAPHLSTLHFSQPHDMFSIFFPHKDYPIPARQRARAFLWIVWHYLEGGAVLPPGNEKAVQNPFADEQAAASMQRARSKWDSLDEAQRKKCTLGGRGTIWQGVRNKDVAEKTATISSATDLFSKEGASGDVAASQPATSKAASPSPGPGAGPADVLDTEKNEPYTHRILAPAFSGTTLEEIRKENVDLPNEIEWGRTQAHERRVFMVRAALEEKEKAEAEARGEPIPAHLGGKGKGKGKRRSRGGAAAAAAASAAAEDARARIKMRAAAKRRLEEEESAASGGGKNRRISMSPSGVDDELMQTIGDYDDDDDDGPTAAGGMGAGAGARGSSAGSPFTMLGDRGMGIPSVFSGASINSVMPNFRRALNESDLTLFNPSNAAAMGANGEQNHLSRLAWNRILQRAVRGQGDACYDSDEEEAAMDERERCGEMFGGELGRILGCVWKEGRRIGTRPALPEGGGAAGGGGGEAKPRAVPDPYARSAEVVSQQ